MEGAPKKGSKGGHFVRWIIIKNSMLIRSSCARARALLFLRILEFHAFDSNIYQYITDLNGRKNPSKWEKKSVDNMGVYLLFSYFLLTR